MAFTVASSVEDWSGEVTGAVASVTATGTVSDSRAAPLRDELAAAVALPPELPGDGVMDIVPPLYGGVLSVPYTNAYVAAPVSAAAVSAETLPPVLAVLAVLVPIVAPLPIVVALAARAPGSGRAMSAAAPRPPVTIARRESVNDPLDAGPGDLPARPAP
jgi:hypothetical protein